MNGRRFAAWLGALALLLCVAGSRADDVAKDAPEGGAPKGEAPRAPQPKPAPTRSRARIHGEVSVKQGAREEIAACTLTTVNRVAYTVLLDENGLKLAKERAGQRASVLGYVTGQGETRAIQVISFGEVKKPEPKRTPPRRSTTPPKRTTKKISRSKS